MWLDIFSIPQFHAGCKLIAVNSPYVYASAADGFLSIASDFCSSAVIPLHLEVRITHFRVYWLLLCFGHRQQRNSTVAFGIGITHFGTQFVVRFVVAFEQLSASVANCERPPLVRN